MTYFKLFTHIFNFKINYCVFYFLYIKEQSSPDEDPRIDEFEKLAKQK